MYTPLSLYPASGSPSETRPPTCLDSFRPQSLRQLGDRVEGIAVDVGLLDVLDGEDLAQVSAVLRDEDAEDAVLNLVDDDVAVC